MKRSVNFSRTRQARSAGADMVKFLRDLGYTDEQIQAQLQAHEDRVAEQRMDDCADAAAEARGDE